MATLIIDGGNTYYKDDAAPRKELAAKGLRYIDCGTSGGVWGLERGYCLMIGGEKGSGRSSRRSDLQGAGTRHYGSIERTGGREDHDQRAEHGYIHAGPVGAGHFVKMIHNGIEYGMMQAMAEGFDILKGRGSDRLPADERFDLNMADIAEVWRRGSVVRRPGCSIWTNRAAMAKDVEPVVALQASWRIRREGLLDR